MLFVAVSCAKSVFPTPTAMKLKSHVHTGVQSKQANCCVKNHSIIPISKPNISLLVEADFFYLQNLHLSQAYHPEEGDKCKRKMPLKDTLLSL